MLLLSLLTAVAAATAPTHHVAVDSALRVHVTVDSTHSEIIVTAGPFHLPAMPAMDDMPDMGDMGHETSQLMRFNWPVDGWMRGFHVDVSDAAGHPLPSAILHHLIGVNFDRRQLVYPAIERLFGWGAETQPVELPKSLGVPLKPGERLGMYAMFHNETGKDINAAYLRLTLLYTPRKGNHPVEVLPFYVDVNNVIGGATTFDVPPGKSSRSYEFELPVGVRMIGVGGHLHDYGSAVMLEDAETGKVLVRLKAKRDKSGHVLGVGRFIFGFNTDALHLEANHKYRVVADYFNPTNETMKDGGMGHINGAVIADDISKWPALDPNNPMIRKDIATLPAMSEMNPGARATPDRQTSRSGRSGNMHMENMPMDHMGHAPLNSDRSDGSRPDSTKIRPRQK